MIRPKPVVLVTLSGIGVSPILDGNALKQAKMPAWDHLTETYPVSLLEASGSAIGLPSSKSGSSEAGHRTIGLGRPWKISEARVESGLSESSIRTNALLRKQFRRLAKSSGALHLIGLLSGDTSYSNQAYVEAIAQYAKEIGIAQIYFHVILDGVESASDSGLGIVRAFASRMRDRECGTVVSVCGRTYGMDHDGFWNRTEQAFRAMMFGTSEKHAKTVEEAIQQSYDADVFDDQCIPTVISSSVTSHHVVHDGDLVLFWNTRPYGMRQLLKAFSLPTIQSFDRPPIPDITCISLIEYDYDLPVEVIFPIEQPWMTLGQVLSQSGLRQLRVAEAERFAHVTVFMNGMREELWPGEDRIIVPSPAVSSYDLVPEMAMADVSDHVIKAIASGSYDVIVCNLCAPDIASQFGREDLVIKACEAMDRILHRLVEGVLAVGGVLVAVGDTGHAEALRNQLTNEINKHGSSNPVPCVIVGSAYEGLKASAGDIVGGDLALSKSTGTLADVAPTILHILSLPIPKEMVGKSLV